MRLASDNNFYGELVFIASSQVEWSGWGLLMTDEGSAVPPILLAKMLVGCRPDEDTPVPRE